MEPQAGGACRAGNIYNLLQRVLYRMAAKIYASELPMETMDDFIRLIYVRLYGSRKKMRYRIEKAEGANKISGEFDFPDFAIIKR